MKSARIGSRSRFRKAVALTLMGVALLASAGTVHAGSWASVNPDGTLAKSRGVLANFRDATGFYRIVFRKKLDNCVPVVTMSDNYAFVLAFETGNPGEVQVQLVNPALSVFVDGSFHIGLVC